MRKMEGRTLRPRVVGPEDLRSRAGKKERGGRVLIGAVLALIVIVALLVLAPAASAFADEGGCVDLGVIVGERVEGPASGDTGTVELGVAVGLGKQEDESEVGENGGTVALGIAVGYRHQAGENTVVFDAGKGAFEGGLVVLERTVATGTRLDPPDPAPKRAGWQFAGWHEAGSSEEGWDPEGASAVPLGASWDFLRPVTSDMTLHARWEIRLDVTVPVEVGFGVSVSDEGGAGSLRQTIAPEDGLYAVRSRTVREVTVESLAAETREDDVSGFFQLPEDVLFDGMGREDELWAWTDALAVSALALTSDGRTVRAYLSDGTSWSETASGAAWSDSTELTESEMEAFTVPAFAYGGSVVENDASWQGQERCERLPLAIDLEVPKRALDVRSNIEGPKPITRLKLTVSARV